MFEAMMRMLSGDFAKLIDLLHREEGVWILGDARTPDVVIPVVSRGGKVYPVEIGKEPLSKDGFSPTLTMHGPYKAEPPPTGGEVEEMLREVQQMLWQMTGADPAEQNKCPHCLAVKLAEQIATLKSVQSNLGQVPTNKKELH